MSGDLREQRVAAMASGGLDSCVLLDWLADRYGVVTPIYVSCGLVWETAERQALERFLEAVGRSDVGEIVHLPVDMDDVYGEEWFMTGKEVPHGEDARNTIYIPGRNVVLLAKTAIYCASRDLQTLALAFIQARQADHPDATDEFLKMYAHLIEAGLGFSLQIIAPFRETPKAEVIQMGQHLPLHLSLSCFNPQGEKHCGVCYSCTRRREAFAVASVEDQTEYLA